MPAILWIKLGDTGGKRNESEIRKSCFAKELMDCIARASHTGLPVSGTVTLATFESRQPMRSLTSNQEPLTQVTNFALHLLERKLYSTKGLAKVAYFGRS